MAAIGLAAALLERRDPDAVMGSFAADHVIADAGGVPAQRGHRGRRRPRRLAGDDRDRADPRLDGVRLHPPRRRRCPGHAAAYAVREFVEKPSAEVAEGYLATGRYRWNAGMFVVRPGVLLDLLGAGDPGSPRRCARSPPTRRGSTSVADAAEDRARPRGRRAGRRRRPGGDRARRRSAGTTSATSTRSRRCWAARASTVLGDADLVEAIDATGLVVPAGGRMVAVVGLDDVVVVDTPDARAGHHPRPGAAGQAGVDALKDARAGDRR